MANATNEATAVAVVKPMGITQLLSQLKVDIPTVIAAGDFQRVSRLRTQLVNLNKLTNELKGVFDHSLMAAKSGFSGDDFLVEIVEDPDSGKTIRREIETIVDRTAKRGRKPREVDPDDFL